MCSYKLFTKLQNYLLTKIIDLYLLVAAFDYSLAISLDNNNMEKTGTINYSKLLEIDCSPSVCGRHHGVQGELYRCIIKHTLRHERRSMGEALKEVAKYRRTTVDFVVHWRGERDFVRATRYEVHVFHYGE